MRRIIKFDKEIWWQWDLRFWRIGIELSFDFNKYKYFSFKIYPLLFAVRIYLEWD